MSARTTYLRLASATTKPSSRLLFTVAVPVAAFLVGAIVRGWLLLGPLREMEADEAIVGLMALHILQGEHQAFYWGQPYLGSLEAYSAALAFAILGPSPVVLKAVPLVYSLLFIILLYWYTRLAFGPCAAVLAAAYVAVPPAFLATWSLKARGGYIETLVLGQVALVLALLILSREDRWSVRWAGVLGLTAGVALWTHPLSIVYSAPTVGLVLWRYRSKLRHYATLALIVGAIVGAWPLVQFNLANGMATWHALFSGGLSLGQVLRHLVGQARYSWPVLLGLAQASTSAELFAADFARRPGHVPAVAIAIMVMAILVVLYHRRGLVKVFSSGATSTDLAGGLLLLIALANIVATTTTRFGELVSEPRYLLPLYCAVPLAAVMLGRLQQQASYLGLPAMALVLGINIYSLITIDPRLNLPSNVGESSEATRQELASFLIVRGLDRVYTDYWIGYPLAMETGERVVPAVISGGFNRYLPYAHAVSTAPRPAFVFVAGRVEEKEFTSKLAALGGSSARDEVSIYVVYYDFQPPHVRAMLP